MNWGIISSWCRDGTSFLANAGALGRRSSIWAASAAGGAPRKVRDDGYAWSVSRDGSWVAFKANPGRGFYREMWVMRTDGEQARKLYEAGEDGGFQGAEWSPDGRMIYSLPKTGAFGESCNFWAVRIDSRTGKAIQEPKHLTNWAGFCVDNPRASADGKKLAFRKWSAQAGVYVAGLEAGAMGITSPRRLTMNEGRNYPAAWTADSKALIFASYLDGHWSIFKQSIEADEAERIVASDDVDGTPARISPDGAWVLYLTRAKNPILRLIRPPSG